MYLKDTLRSLCGVLKAQGAERVLTTICIGAMKKIGEGVLAWNDVHALLVRMGRVSEVRALLVRMGEDDEESSN